MLNELEMNSPPQREDEDDDILYEEVERAKHQLKKGKSPGIDGIRGEMISAGGEKLKEELYKLCRQVWKERRVPEEWTQSLIIVTIPKKGNLTECKNYRTIALMSHIGKVLMIVLLNPGVET